LNELGYRSFDVVLWWEPDSNILDVCTLNIFEFKVLHVRNYTFGGYNPPKTTVTTNYGKLLSYRIVRSE